MGLFKFLKKENTDKQDRYTANKENIPMSFILLSKGNWSKEKIINDVKTDWNLIINDTSNKKDAIFANWL